MKKKNIITVLILSLLFSAQNVWRDADAKTEQEQINEVDKNIQLSEVVADVEYPDAVTNEQEWEVNKENKYEFPIDCEDGQWSQYGTHDEMLEACTVPDKVLEDATTEQLLDMVLDYPLLCDIYAFDTVEQGVAVVASRFNGFAELIDRDDFSDVVLDRYVDVDIQEGIKDTKENFSRVSEIVVMEDMLAQEDVVSDLTLQERRKLVEAVERKTKEKIDTNIFSENATTFYDVAIENGVKEQLGLEEFENPTHDKVRVM